MPPHSDRFILNLAHSFADRKRKRENCRSLFFAPVFGCFPSQAIFKPFIDHNGGRAEATGLSTEFNFARAKSDFDIINGDDIVCVRVCFRAYHDDLRQSCHMCRLHSFVRAQSQTQMVATFLQFRFEATPFICSGSLIQPVEYSMNAECQSIMRSHQLSTGGTY